MARVIPDVPALDRPFDYSVPAAFDGAVRPGTIVRVPLHGRRVRGWVVSRGERPATDRPLQPVAAVVGLGPAPDVIDLAGWAAWRWAGRGVTLLRAASPPTIVRGLPAGDNRGTGTAGPRGDDGDGARPPAVGDAFDGSPAVVRLAPADDPLPYVLEAARRGDALVLTPSVGTAAYLGAILRRHGHAVALLPQDWARAAAGGCVALGARRAAWAPRPRLGAVVVLDEHDETYQEERAPTWHARDVAVERARRAGVPCVLTSPCPSLEALGAARLVTTTRAEERSGWPVVEVVDRRQEAPGLGLYSERLVALLRQAGAGRRVVCVLNRKGRARLLACTTCGELARCDACGAATEEAGTEEAGTAGDGTDRRALRCRRCGALHPVVCLACGSARLKVLSTGVTRAREELARLAGQPVGEVTADTGSGPPPPEAVLVGTEAVLHRVARAWVVAFLDLDQELVAPRYRAAEEALALLARAARVVGGRADGGGPDDGRAAGGRLVLQTRLPHHEVVDAAVHADPSRLSVVEAARRAALGFPPERALALLAGEAAEEYAARLAEVADLEVMGPSSGRWLVRAEGHRVLCDALAATPRPKGRLRVAVDPLRA